jgi:predicted phosphodiesterase
MANRLGVIADIHGNAWALEAVLEDAREKGVTRLVNLGDVFYGPLKPLETHRMLAGTDIAVTISGNVDRLLHEASDEEITANATLAFDLQDLGAEPVSWLKNLPATATLDREIFLCHGAPLSDTEYLLEDVSSVHPLVLPEGKILERLGTVRETVVLCAHSHVPRTVHLSTGQLIVNPGSVGLPAYNQDTPVMHSMESYAPHACYAILEKTTRGWNASIHRVAYDWNAAARQARALGREDWARGIATGRML